MQNLQKGCTFPADMDDRVVRNSDSSTVCKVKTCDVQNCIVQSCIFQPLQFGPTFSIHYCNIPTSCQLMTGANNYNSCRLFIMLSVLNEPYDVKQWFRLSISIRVDGIHCLYHCYTSTSCHRT